MDFTFSHEFFDGPASLYSSLKIEGDRGTLVRQAAAKGDGAIGVFSGRISAAVRDALIKNFPAQAPAGPRLAPGMPNHLLTLGPKQLRLIHDAGVLAKVPRFTRALEQAEKEASATPVQTLAVRWDGRTGNVARVELIAGGTTPILIPDASVIEILGAPAAAAYPQSSLGKASGEIRLPAGGRRMIEIRLSGTAPRMQAAYRRRGIAAAGSAEIFGNAMSVLVSE